MPAFRATTEGDSNSGVLTGPERRHQQLELEARGRGFAIAGIEFRRDGRWPTGFSGRVVELALAMGAGDRQAFGRAFAANWVGSPTLVIPTRRVSLPALSRPANPPAPFSIRLPFALAVVHAGRNDLLWEIGLSTPDRSAYLVDAESTGALAAGRLDLGPGCRDPRGAMQLSVALFAGVEQVRMPTSVFLAPPRAPVALMLGAADPRTRLPGVCSAVRTDVLWTAPLGMADANGTLSSRTLLFGPWQRRWLGETLYLQAVSTAYRGSAFWLSNGLRVTMPTEHPAPESQRVLSASRLGSSVGGVRANFGAVVRFF